MFKNVSKQSPVICWWSGGAASALACWYCILWFGLDKVRIVFIDTKNEDPDTYRFKKDCELWYGKNIETIFSKEYENIEEVWDFYSSLNNATGAICSAELKRKVRILFQNKNAFSHQAFGYEIEEINRAADLKNNHPDSRPIFPLIYMFVKKKDCLKMLLRCMIQPPDSYKHGFLNNNCLLTGCVQGGIGYWKLYQVVFPERFDKMAEREHHYTDIKGYPVTICKDQSKGGGLVFLKHNPKYPHIKDISMMKGIKPEPLMECNGFCTYNKEIKAQ